MLELLIALICFLGLFTGLIIGFSAEEELKPGKKYFSIILKALFILIVFFNFYYLDKLMFGVVALVLLSIVLFSTKKDFPRTLYFLSTIPLAYSFETVVIPALVFFYGLTLGSIYYYEAKNKKWFDLVKGLFVKYYYFLIIIVILNLIL